MNGPSCISWCITYLTCAGVIIPHNGGDKCFYVTSISGDLISDASMDQYEIYRVCLPRANGQYRFHLIRCLILLFQFEMHGQAKRVV